MERRNYKQSGTGLGHIVDMIRSARPWSLRLRRTVTADVHFHGLNEYDYGARWYDPVLARFTTVDPLCEKYYNISPYAYCANNPVNAVDPDGRKIKPFSKNEYDVIKSTLTEDDRKYVVLDENGFIDYSVMKNHMSISDNYKKLYALSSSELIYNFTISSSFIIKNNEGEIKPYALSYCPPEDEMKDSNFESSSGLTTGESGKYAVTLLPNTSTSGINSFDDNIHIYIHPQMSRAGLSEAFSHEAYGHAFLYEATRNRSLSKHAYKGSHDMNGILVKCIIDARKETINNIERYGF